MRFIFLFIVLSCISKSSLLAQSTDSVLFAKLDIAPRWTWRGVVFSNSPVFQPSLGFDNGRLTLPIKQSLL